MPLLRVFFLSIVLPIVLSAAAVLPARAQADRPPNIVLILIDDLGWTDVGSFGSTFYQTPHIDRLAREGVRFTNAYTASPVCSPTRASILTGKDPVRLDLTDWIPGRADRPDQRLLQHQDQDRLTLDHRTLADVLGERGYATASIGKWHLGDGAAYLPTGRGFDVNIAGNERGSPPSYHYPYRRRDWRDTTRVYALDDLIEGGAEGEYLTDRLGEEAARFIGEHRDEPFFLYFTQYAVHTPLQARADLQAKYEALRVPVADSADFGHEGSRPVRIVQNHAVYAAMVESMDRSVGRILEALDTHGLRESTLVVFFSDNGGLATSEGWPTSNRPLRTGKGWLYEGGIRVPLVVHWPGVTEAGRTVVTPVISNDFFPTLAEIAGADVSADTLDGLSLVPLLRGGNALDRDALFWHYPQYSNQGGTPSGAVREGAHKLIEFYEDGRVELYDLTADIGERNDLSATRPDLVEHLRSRLDAWRTALDAPMPVPNPDFARDE